MHLSAFCNLDISLTALLESIMSIALCQHNTLAYYAFYYAGIFDAGLEL